MHLLHKQFALNPNPNPCIKPDNPGFLNLIQGLDRLQISVQLAQKLILML